MNTASLVLATALAAFVGCAQPAAAQTQDRTGAATVDQATPDDNGGATTGSGRSDESGDDSAAEGQSQRRQWNDRGPMVMPMRPMMPQRHMMMGGAGARFHFARGNARMDVTCSAQEDTEACVRAAGQLIDKLAQLHGADRDNTTGSARRGGERPNAAAPSDDEEGVAGERM